LSLNFVEAVLQILLFCPPKNHTKNKGSAPPIFIIEV